MATLESTVKPRTGDPLRTSTTRANRITSTEIKVMRLAEQKTTSPLATVTRAFAGFWSSLTNAVGELFAPKQAKKSFCDLNGHSLTRIGNSTSEECRFCGKQIQSLEELRSTKY